MAIHDAFVVKYEAVSGEANSGLDDATGGEGMKSVKLAGQRYLPLHCDQSSHSFTISLNASADYEGGGTYFPAMGSVLRPGQKLAY